MSAPLGEPRDPARDPISAAARAAGLLEAACRSTTRDAQTARDALLLETVGALAQDLGRQLDALARLSSEDDAPDVLVEAASRCADVANLAACAAPHLPPDDGRGSPAEVVRSATRAVHALHTLVEARRGGNGAHAENVLRDLGSATWRADLALRQVDGPAEGVAPG